MKKLLFTVLILFASAQIWAQSVTIIESVGWLESAYVKWTATADSFNVYYSGEGINNKKIDTQLIRNYGTHYRADVLGLKTGNYTLKIVPVINDTEGEGTSTNNIEVKAHHRSGFAFANGGVPGAYNLDGTLKANAEVIYLTARTAKTVELDVVVDNKGKIETGTGIDDILKKREKNIDHSPLVIRIIGKITNDHMPNDVVKASYIDLKRTNDVTVEGVGDDATAFGWGIHARESRNIEVRNLAFMRFTDDGISLEVNNSNIWLHNNDFFYGKQGSGDKAKGDGALDVKTSALVTVSYNHFWDSGKANLLGNGVETEERLTYHHNWYNHSDSRHPRVRCHTVHVYNNYYLNISKYCVGATMGSSIFSEANYFENSRNPMLISMQGSDIDSGNGTFSSENGGIIKSYNNYMDAFSSSRFKPYGVSNTVEFDAYVASTRNETVPATVAAKRGGATYNNFDTNTSIMYSYTPDSPEQAKAKVMQYAGRMFGGDFQPFDKLGTQADNDDPLPALAAAIDAYASALVSIQGNGSGSGSGSGGSGTNPGDEISSDVICTFTSTGATNSAFTAVGDNPTTSNGPVTVNGVTYTHAWKMNSKGSVSFSTADVSTLTLVFAPSNSGNRIIVDGQTITIPAGGIVVVEELPAGSHRIERANGESQLFYISIAYPEDDSSVQNIGTLNFTVYPNPVVNSLNISSEVEIKNIEIYNLTGLLVQSVRGENISSIDVSDLKSGSYFIRIQTAEGIRGHMIIKK